MLHPAYPPMRRNPKGSIVTPRPTTELLTNGDDLPGIPAGTRLQCAYRPEYGDSVRVIAWRRPGERLYTDLASIRFVPRAELCTTDCGHRVPGMPLECAK